MGPGLVVSLGVFLLYHVTFSSVPTSDGYAWVAAIDRTDYGAIFSANHPLPLYALHLLRRGLAALGLPMATLSLIQTVNAVAAALGAVLQYTMIRLLGGGLILGTAGSLLLATSFGYWYFANGEIHHFSLVVLLTIFAVLVRMRVSGRRLSDRYLIGLGVLNAVAVLLHQENFLFGLGAVAMLAVGSPWRVGLRDGFVYTVSGSLATVILVVAVGLGLRGLSSLEDVFHWYVTYVGSWRRYPLGNLPLAPVKMLKGQLTAFVFGTQVVTDSLREPHLLGFSSVRWLLGLTALAYGMMIFLAIQALKSVRHLTGGRGVAFIGCVAWFLAYKLVLHWWFWPTAPEYHVVTLPPLILLLLAGPIAVGGQPAATRWVPRAAPVIALLVLVATVNFGGAIGPWHRYGTMKETLAAELKRNYRPDDLFISSESGVDVVFRRSGNYVAMKDLFKSRPKAEAFASLLATIADHLGRGRRVFVYNFVPATFTLFGVNLARVDEAPLVEQDFEAFFAALRERYDVRPVRSYWEEAKEPLYLYGARLETLWEVRERSKPPRPTDARPKLE